MNFHCNKEGIERPYDYTFVIPVDIYPLKKSYSLTDTIWLEADIIGKMLYDTKRQQNILVDSGAINLGAGLNEFGTYITNPANGFCEVTGTPGGTISRYQSQWGTSVSLDNYGCGQSGYRCRIGFKPNYKGTFNLSIPKEGFLGSCNSKPHPYYASVGFQYKNVDLNKNIFDALSKNDQGGNDGVKYYTGRIQERTVFIFKVE